MKNKFLISFLMLTLFLTSEFSFADDIELLIDSSMGGKVLGAIDFPFEIRFPADKSLSPDGGYPLGEANIGDIEFLAPGQNIDIVNSGELSKVFEEAILNTVKSYRNKSLNLEYLDSDEKKAIQLIAKALPLNTPVDIGILQGKGKYIKEALELIVTKKRIKFEVLWVRFNVVSRPDILLKNPIELSNLSTRTKAKAQACVKAFGKWWCAKATTPWVRVNGKYAYLDMISKDAAVYVLPRFENLNVVMVIKVFKWRIKIPIGVTSIVNREIRKKGPVKIIDFSFYEQKIPYSNKKSKIESVSVNNNPSGLLIKSKIKIE